MAASVTDSTLLDVAKEPHENEEPMDEETMYRKLLMQAAEMQGLDPNASTPTYHRVKPEPGFCIKTKNGKKEKVFINVCVSFELPAPLDITEGELVKILESDEPNYRVPLSIGEGHAEVDKSGKGCIAYDVLINTSFYEKVQKSDVFKGFLMSVIFEGLENKYQILLDRNWIQLKNRKSLGNLNEHNIRTKSKPRILEMESADGNSPGTGTQEKPRAPLITEVDSPQTVVNASPKPDYTIMREPAEGHPEFLVVEIKLPGVRTTKTLSLDLGEDRVLLHAHPNLYHLDIYLPFSVDAEESGAQFNRDNKILTLTLPVLPLSR
ncbi:PIH1 domain-containing protein 1-like [Acanthaster planci]|uniref:PIH1 domain-containing protein 1 n=1 Tax=Acanthaster planci TaxID=133434 RepID=A0A8B7YQN7_ACAPL|nr:PIH1 domain-containing protein 1-like [Acanthaster planci]